MAPAEKWPSSLWVSLPLSLSFGPLGEEEWGGVRFEPDAKRETNLAVRAARVGTWITCYHPTRVGTGKSDPVLSRVEPVAHVSRHLGRVKVARRPVLAGERDVSVSRAFRVGAPDLASHQGCRPAVPKPHPPRGVRQPVDVTGPWAIAATPFYPFNATVGFRLLGPSSSPMVTDGCGCP